MTVLIRVAIFILLSVLSMTSCGMQGDLYLPEEESQADQ